MATDVAARGLHVDDIELVLHVDPPHGPKEYLHRSGRTARAGASGQVISIATLRQQRQVAAITGKAGASRLETLRAGPATRLCWHSSADRSQVRCRPDSARAGSARAERRAGTIPT